MIDIAPQNAASTKITVTNTATALFDLMNTAGSVQTSQAYYGDKTASGVMITPEDGDIRILFGGTPTASLGDLLKQGTRYYFPGVAPANLKLIRVNGSDVLASVTLYVSKPGESPTATSDPNAFLSSAEDDVNDVLGVAIRPMDVSTYSWTQYQNNSFQTANIKATAGNLAGFTVVNTTASVRYIQFHKTATTPAGGGAVTAFYTFLIAANSERTVGADFFGHHGMHSTLGWAVANSSTAATYTAATAGDLLATVHYK